MLAPGKTITVAFDDPRIKPIACLLLVEKLVPVCDVAYIDYDLQFSSFLQNLSDERFEWIHRNRRLTVIEPTEDAFRFVEAIVAEKLETRGVLILDSLNTLQASLTDATSTQGSKIANQESSILITILQQVARFCSKSFVIVNITKSRPRGISASSSSFWEKVLVGGRMIKFKSDSILSVKQVSLGGVSRIEIQDEETTSRNRSSSIRSYIL